MNDNLLTCCHDGEGRFREGPSKRHSATSPRHPPELKMTQTLPDHRQIWDRSRSAVQAGEDLLLLAPEGQAHLVFRRDGTLWSQGKLVRLAPLQQRLLRCFCERAGEVIRRDDLIEAAWKRSSISEQSLARAIHLLRRVLDESGLGVKCISTLYGSGYILTVSVSRDLSAASTVGTPKQSVAPEPQPTVARPPQAAEIELTPKPASPRNARQQRAVNHGDEAHIRLQRRNPAVLAAALQHLHHAEQLCPGESAIRLDLCRALTQHALWGLRDSGDCSQAIHNLIQQTTIPPEQRSNWQAIESGTLSLLDWQPSVSEKRFGTLLSQVEEPGDALAAWSAHLLATGRPAAAYQAMKSHLDLHLPWGWALTAWSLWLLNDADGAIQALQNQLVLDPEQVLARLLLALIHCHRGRAREASSLMEQTVRLSRASLSSIGHPLLITALTGVGATDQAILMLKDSLRQPRQPWPSLWGIAALRLGAQVEASIWFERAVDKRCPLAPFLWQSPLVQAYRGHPSLGRLAKAMEVFSLSASATTLATASLQQGQGESASAA